MALRNVEFHPDAIAELIEAAEYFRLESIARADAFHLEVGNALDRLRNFPQSGVLAEGGVRYTLLGRFSYLLIYRPERNVIRVIAVAHTSRKPGYWRRRR